MRYDDASQAGSNSDHVQARDDTEQLAGNDFGPATGNIITGAGTMSGSAGTDMSGPGGHITAISGAGGSDDSFDAAGNLQVAGQYGTLTIDATGNYTYARNPGSPEGVSDTFTYTLADAAGSSDQAKLVIAIGNPPILNAQGSQTIQTANGVIVLPAGVELSDVHVQGRNLVITLPDGSTMVIPDGAVFVPQLVVNGVEVPASNLAALLIDSEPKPAAGDQGPNQLSSGGNFEVPVSPLDPGVPLGDLIPPTELYYTPPEVKEIIPGEIDEEPIAGLASVSLDDDVIPGKGGNAGGTLDNPPDTVGQNVQSGTLPGSGGDGALTWAFQDTGEPSADFTYTVNPDGSVTVTQQQDGNPVIVLTVDLNTATGDFEVTQVNPIRHLSGADENNTVLVINYTVTDSDGDVAPGTLSIDVDDDTPVVSVTAGSDANVILTTDDAQTIGVNSDTDASSVDFSGVFSGATVSPGADGAGSGTSHSYALNITGSSSGLFSHGVAINLYKLANGDVVGSTALTAPATSTDASVVFSISVTASGVVTLTQNAQIDHAAETPSGSPFNDQFTSMADGLVTLTRSETVVDKDGDSVTGSASVNIGANLHFTDDGPSIDGARVNSSVTVDETDGAEPVSAGAPIVATSAAPMVVGNAVNYGADGPGGNPVYGLTLLGGGTSVSSGLATALGDHPITLNLTSSTLITATYNDGTDHTAFTIQMNSDGTVTVTQYTALEHLIDGSTPADYDDALHLTTVVGEVPVSLVNATVTYEDFDHDTASASAAIGGAITFKDDGPSVSIAVGTESAVQLITDDEGTEGVGSTSASTTANFAGVFSLGSSSGGGDGTASVPLLQYQLGTAGGASGLTSHGNAINLYMVGTTVVGAIGSQPANLSDPDIVFTVAVDGNGVVTLTQLQQIDHADEAPGATDAPFNDQSTHIALDSLITLTASATIMDNDGDTASDSETVNIAANLIFRDDGPTVSGPTVNSSVLLDETDGSEPVSSGAPIVASSAAAMISASVDYGADGQGPAPVYGLSLLGGVTSIGSGLATALGDHPITLNLTSPTLITATYNDGTDHTAFTIQMNANGTITVTQYTALEHSLDGSTPAAYDDALDLVDGLNNLVNATVTYEDFDGDTATATVGIGGAITFEDDGPSINVTKGSDANILLVTDDHGTEGVGSTTASTTADFAGAFAIGSSNGGGDGTASVSAIGYQLTTAGGASGLSSHGVAINLYNVGGVIVGSTALSAPATATDASVVFAVSVSGTGVVTLTQYQQIDHPIADDPSATGTPFNDQSIHMLTDNLIQLTATATITDNDGDTATDSETIDIASNLVFRDDGPTAVNDGSRGTFNDNATNVNIGNVSVLLANDSYHADGPAASGAITIATGSLGGTITIDGSGNMLYTSNHDTLPGNTDVETFTYTIKDFDGDTATATFTVSLSESGPSIGTTAFTVDEEGLSGGIAGTVYGDSSDVAGQATTVSGTLAGFSFGGDGQGATGNIVLAASADTGLRTLSGGIVETVWNPATHTLTGYVDTDNSNTLNGAETAVFTLQIDDVATGHYVFNLLQPVKHATANTEDDKLLSVNVTVTDSDNDPANGVINITIDDDSPQVSNVSGGASVTLDETTAVTPAGFPIQASSLTAVITATTAFGADGAAAANATVYGLSLAGGVTTIGSGLATAIGDFPITLNLVDSTHITGTYVNGGTQTAFTITMNANGTITVVQNVPLEHLVDGSTPAAYNDALDLVLDGGALTNLVNATITITDGDGDTHSGSTPIGDQITFLDDGPSIDVTAGADGAVTLTTDDHDTIGVATDTSTPTTINFGGVFGLTSSGGADGAAAAPTLAFQLDVTGYTGPAGVDSGLDQGGANIYLYEIGGKVVGSTSSTLGGVTVPNTVFDVSVSGTGVVTLTQYSQIDHPTHTSSNYSADVVSLTDTLVTLTASSTITDNDGDTASDSAVVNIGANLRFTDDGPSISGTGALEPTLQVDESNFGGNAGPTSFAGLFNVSYGADGPAASNSIVYSLGINAGSSGLVDTLTNQAVLLKVVAGVVHGYVTISGVDTDVFTISVNSSGEVTLDQMRAIVHPDINDPNDDKTFAADNLITLSATVTDGDGDTASLGTPINIAQDFHFLDDGPTITTAATDPLNMPNTGTTPTGIGNFAFNVGADYTTNAIDLSGFTVSINGTPLPAGSVHLVAGTEDAHSANYTFSFDYDSGIGGTVTTTGTLIFYKDGTIAGHTAGTYEVVLTSGPVSGFTLASTGGASVSDFVGYDAPGFVGGSAEIQDVHIGDNLFIQFTSGNVGQNGTFLTTDFTAITPAPAPEVPADPNQQWVTGDLFTDNDANAEAVIASNTAIGASGNTLQNEELIDFNLYNSDPGATVGTPTTHQGEMFIVFDQISSVDDLIVVLKLVDTVTGVYTTKTLVVNADDLYTNSVADKAALAGTAYEGISLSLDNTDGLLIVQPNDYNTAGTHWEIVGGQILVSPTDVDGTGIAFNGDINVASTGTEAFSTDTDTGGAKITSIGFLVPSTTDQNATIEFDVKVTDADGDSVTQNDVTVQIGTPTPPVVLDLNGDGVHFLGQDAGVQFDYGAGLVSTAWAAADDGILVRDANSDGNVTASEFVFGGNGVTDMEALHAQYGDQLDASDADFTQFAVWNDANSNGVVDGNELQSLAEAGITSIGLVSDGVSYTSANGDVQVAGTSTYTKADGSTGDAADAAFATGSVAKATQEIERVAANSNTTALAAAVAAAGVVASSAAAASTPSFGVGEAAMTAAIVGKSAFVGMESGDEGSHFSALSFLSSGGFEANSLPMASTSHTAIAAAEIGQISSALAANSAPNALLDATDFGTIMQMPTGPSGMSVAMPSVQALIAAASGIEAQGSALNIQHTGQVEQILADALHGGNGGMDINALLNALPGAGLGDNAGLHGLATPVGGDVSTWDMGHGGGFTFDVSTIMSHQPMVLHADAIQPVANG
jgi:hypothetical protein